MHAELEESLGRFETYLRYERRYSEHTVAAYVTDVREFFSSLPMGEVEFSALSRSDVAEWMSSRIAQGCKPTTVNRGLSALRYYFRFLRREGLIVDDPTYHAQSLRVPKRLPTVLTEKETAHLFDQVVYPEGWQGQRDRLILLLLYTLGVRRSELLTLTWGDFSSGYREVRVLGKGRKERLLPVLPEASELLSSYRAAVYGEFTALPRDGHVILDDHGQPMKVARLYRLVRDYLGQVTTQSYRGPHVLRHSFATHMLEEGADILTIKRLLGHSSLRSTQVYTHVDASLLRKEYQQAHPHAQGAQLGERPKE